jgi:hypothetical protein
MMLLMTAAIALLGRAIRNNWAVPRTKWGTTGLLLGVLGFSVLTGDPTVYPYIRRFSSPNFEIQLFWLITTQWLPFCLGLLYLNTDAEPPESPPKSRWLERRSRSRHWLNPW